MAKIFTKKQIFTIPNLLSLFRILLIPIILWLYCGLQEYYWTIVVIAISGLSDMVDGFIARRFNQVSDIGKALDPIADKLTQGTLIICLITRYKLMIGLIIVLAIKEIIMSIFGLIILKRQNAFSSAKWHGKVATAFLYLSLCVLILIPNIPLTIVNIIIVIAMLLVINSLTLYLVYYIKTLLKLKIDKDNINQSDNNNIETDI